MSSQTPPNSGPQQPGVPIPTPHTLNSIDELHDHAAVNSQSRGQLSSHPGGIAINEDILLSTKTKDVGTKANASLQGLTTATTQAKFDRLEEYEGKIADASEGAHKDFLVKQRDALKKELTKDGEKILRDHGKAASQVAALNEAVANDVTRVSEELEREYKKGVKRLSSIKPTDEAHAQQISKELEQMSKAHSANLEAVAAKGAEITQAVSERAAAAAKLAGDVEKHTGLKATDFGSKTLASISKGGAAPEGMWEKAKANFTGKDVKTGTKILRGAGTVVGLGAIIDGTKKIFAPKRNEQGEREGSLFGAVGEVGAGAAIAYVSAIHGGKAGHAR